MLAGRAMAGQPVTIVPGSMYLSNPAPCAGQTLTLYLTVANGDYPTDAPGQALVDAVLAATSTHPGCGIVSNVTQTDKFWVIDAAGLPATPTTSDPNDGGHSFPIAASPVWNTHNLAIPFTIPAGASGGADLHPLRLQQIQLPGPDLAHGL